jgi:hypothetical protein
LFQSIDKISPELPKKVLELVFNLSSHNLILESPEADAKTVDNFGE